MNYIKFILIITLISCLAGCSKETLDLWSTPNKLWFANVDTIVVASFKKQAANVNEITIDVPVQMAGITTKGDRKFTVEVLKDKRNPATEYRIEDAVVAADSIKGVFRVKITKTPNLAVETDTVTFILRTAGEFETGLTTNLRCTFIITNKYTKPTWWYDPRCGVYSEAKHEVLIAVFGNDNDIRGGGASSYSNSSSWGHVDALYNLWKLNTYCEQNGLPFRFANGQ